MDQPLILTLKLEIEAQHFFNSLRQIHFPPDRNYLDAHLTLFHHLPAGKPEIINDIELICYNYAELALHVTSVKNIGRGVAYAITCTQLSDVHRHLQQRWLQWLTPQDRQKLWPHVTIQNKADVTQVQNLYRQLSPDFKPFDIIATGLILWRYMNGPWEFIQEWHFGR